MLRPTPLLLVVCLAGACDLLPQPEPAPDCVPRRPFWSDADGDGVGDADGALYLGCEAPDGYVDIPPPEPADTDVGDTADSALSGP